MVLFWLVDVEIGEVGKVLLEGGLEEEDTGMGVQTSGGSIKLLPEDEPEP